MGFLAVTTNSGTSFANQSSDLPASTATLQEISCGTASSCVAVGPSPTDGGDVIGVSTANSGTTWTPFTGPPGQDLAGLSPPLMGIACTSASDCVLVFGTFSSAVAYTTTNAGQNWTESAVQ